MIEIAARATDEPVRPTWPWGDYTTKLLEDLAAAVTKFWKHYDPDSTDPAKSKAPTNDEVRDWLFEKRGVAKRVGDAMAQVLRVDGLRPGLVRPRFALRANRSTGHANPMESGSENGRNGARRRVRSRRRRASAIIATPKPQTTVREDAASAVFRMQFWIPSSGGVCNS
jgi:hypothetical protein